MDIQAAQLCQQIEQTRTAMTAKLDLSKQYVSQKVAATVEQSVIASVHGLLETTTKSMTLLQHYPWLIIVGGALFGYQLNSAHTRPIRPVQKSVSTGCGGPPHRATGGGSRHASGL